MIELNLILSKVMLDIYRGYEDILENVNVLEWVNVVTRCYGTIIF